LGLILNSQRLAAGDPTIPVCKTEVTRADLIQESHVSTNDGGFHISFESEHVSLLARCVRRRLLRQGWPNLPENRRTGRYGTYGLASCHIHLLTQKHIANTD